MYELLRRKMHALLTNVKIVIYICIYIYIYISKSIIYDGKLFRAAIKIQTNVSAIPNRLLFEKPLILSCLEGSVYLTSILDYIHLLCICKLRLLD